MICLTEHLRMPWAGHYARAFAGMLLLPMPTRLPRVSFRFLGRGDSAGEACSVPTLHFPSPPPPQSSSSSRYLSSCNWTHHILLLMVCTGPDLSVQGQGLLLLLFTADTAWILNTGQLSFHPESNPSSTRNETVNYDIFTMSL